MSDAFVFFATDLHGSERCFRKWLNAAEGYGAGVLVLGGDITGKVIVPVQRRNGSHLALWRGEEHVLDGPTAVVEFERAVADTGAYAWHAEPDEAAATFADDGASERLFARLASERLAGWIALADERLGEKGVKAFAIAGNDDPWEVDEALSSGRTLVNGEQRVVWIEDWLPMLSLGVSTPTPWNSPREVSEEEHGRLVAQLADGLDEPGSAIFNLHVPRMTRRSISHPSSTITSVSATRWPASPARCRSVGRVFAARSSATSRSSACTVMYTRAEDAQRSAAPCVSTRAATTSRASCAACSFGSPARVGSATTRSPRDDARLLRSAARCGWPPHLTVSGEPLSDVPAEGLRIVTAATGRGLTLRLCGGAAIALLCPSAAEPPLARIYKDVDLVGLRRERKVLEGLLVELGYDAREEFNVLEGGARLFFWDPVNGRQLDLLLDRFEMCHAIDLRQRLDRHPVTLDAADLLLTKLQVRETNERDIQDALALLAGLTTHLRDA